MLYAVLQVDGHSHWKCLDTQDKALARLRLAEEAKKASRTNRATARGKRAR